MIALSTNSSSIVSEIHPKTGKEQVWKPSQYNVFIRMIRMVTVSPHTMLFTWDGRLWSATSLVAASQDRIISELKWISALNDFGHCVRSTFIVYFCYHMHAPVRRKVTATIVVVSLKRNFRDFFLFHILLSSWQQIEFVLAAVCLFF